MTLTKTARRIRTTPPRGRAPSPWWLAIALAAVVLVVHPWPEPKAEAQPVIVVVSTDGSGPLPADAQVLAQDAVQRHARVLITGLGDVRDLDTIPHGSTQLDRAADGRNKRLALLDALARPARGSANAGRPVLSLIIEVEQHLRAVPHGEVDVLLFGNSRHFGEGVDLADPVIRGDYAASADRILRSGLLPACRGYRFDVVDAGLGAPAPGDALTNLQSREFYRRLASGCGGVLTLWDTRLLSIPHQGAVPEVSPAAVGRPSVCSPLIRIDSQFLFDTDRSDLKPAAEPLMQRLLAEITVAHPDAAVAIVGYTDSTGTSEHNLALSLNRANRVRAWLNAHGARGGQMSAQGRGAEHPIASNATVRGRLMNRRVDITLAMPSCPAA